MKLRLNFTQSFHLGNTIPNVQNLKNSISSMHFSTPSIKDAFVRMKKNIRKLSPLHWYDGVWDDLDIKL